MSIERSSELNKSSVHKSIEQLLSQIIQPNSKVVVPISELHLDGRNITDAVLSFQTRVTSISEAIAVISIETNGIKLSTRDFMIAQIGSGESAITTITGGINSNQLLEGSGLSSALMEKTDEFVNKILDLSNVPNDQEAIYIVTDRAQGQSKNRDGWTSYQMQKLGFYSDTKQAAALRDALSLPIKDDELARTFFKIY